jgi:hypothetical protein
MAILLLVLIIVAVVAAFSWFNSVEVWTSNPPRARPASTSSSDATPWTSSSDDGAAPWTVHSASTSIVDEPSVFHHATGHQADLGDFTPSVHHHSSDGPAEAAYVSDTSSSFSDTSSSSCDTSSSFSDTSSSFSDTSCSTDSSHHHHD